MRLLCGLKGGAGRIESGGAGSEPLARCAAVSGAVAITGAEQRPHKPAEFPGDGHLGLVVKHASCE